MKNKRAQLFEYAWGITSLIVLITAIINTLKNGFHSSLILYILFAIAALMYYMRRTQGKNNTGMQ